MMRSLALFIGLRFSKAKQRNRLVSFISMSSMIGISVGVMVIIVGLSAMNGFERELKTRVLSVIAHGQLEGVDEPIETWRDIQAKAKAHPEVSGAAPYVLFTGLVEKGVKLKPVQIRGVDLEQEKTVSDLYRYMDAEKWHDFKADKNEIILGKGIAEALDAKVGDMITALLPSSDPEMKLRAPKRIRLKIAGIFNLGGQLDHGLALIPLTDAQSYLGIKDKVTGVALRVKEPLKVAETVREVGLALDEYVYLKNWTYEFGYLYRDIQMVRGIMYLVMVLVIGVACFNIVSTLMMAVKDRSADIAVLRTMGAKDSLVRAIFIWHGLISGLLGSLLGSLLGCFLAVNLTELIQLIEKISGNEFLSGDIYFVDFLPTQLLFSDVAIVSLTAIGLSLLATWYPAQRACKLQPAAVLSAK